MTICESIGNCIWKQVGETRYEVSDTGLVRNAWTKRILKQYKGRDGYMTVGLRILGKTKSIKVHILVLEAFICSRPARMVCDHKDFDRTNNKVTNLEWVTPRENTRRAANAYRIGRIFEWWKI
jgi:hypothetical protein